MNLKTLAKFASSHLNFLVPLLLLIPFYAILYKLYIPRINAFGCFDDCNNFMGGYFMLQGKHIFSDFFFNHQPFAAYISYVIQALSHPQNIFELVLRHRQFVLLFSLIGNIFLIWRFRLSAFIFALIFELSKFYLFGDRFLAEGMIVYPLIYMTGIALLKFSNNKLKYFDYLLIPIATWFVIFMREPYVPLALVLFATFLFEKKMARKQFTSIGLFAILSAVTFSTINLPEYFFNVVTVNYQAVLPSDINAQMFGNRYIQAFFYPLYIFFYGNWNLLHSLIALVNVVFLANLFVLFKNKAYQIVIVAFVILGFANIRVILPGTMFFAAFHMLIWYALFIFITAYLVFQNYKQKALFFVSILIIFTALFSFVSSKSYFPREKYDQQSQFLEYYGPTLQQGEVIRALANPGDTMFLDASDDLIYWQAKIPSPYKYTWYTSAMPAFAKYTAARDTMFRDNPPTFYKEYGSCPKINDVGTSYRLPDFVLNAYVRLYNQDKLSCLFVRKDKIGQISDSQWKKAAEFLYYEKPTKTN